jgi:predicted O-methyltransferase YrrM
MLTDLESQPEWRERLRSLNAVIAGSHEPVLGNLFYDNAQTDFVDCPPIDRYRAKRERFRHAVQDRRRLLEVGVNGCHSAYLALTANPAIEFHGVDICEYSYVQNAVAWLKKEFPGRVYFYQGDSRRVLPALAERGRTFDVFHIDGFKPFYFTDVVNSSRMVSPSGALVVVDDAEQLGVRVALASLTRFNVITRLPEFPSMRRSIGSAEANEVRRLIPSSDRKYLLLKPYSYVLATGRRTKALALSMSAVSGLRPGQ